MKLSEEVKRKPIVAKFYRAMSPGIGACNICGLPWTHCTRHNIPFNNRRGFFAQCEYCYQKSDAETILRANKQLWEQWESQGGHELYTQEEFIDAIHRDLQKHGKKIKKETI